MHILNNHTAFSRSVGCCSTSCNFACSRQTLFGLLSWFIGKLWGLCNLFNNEALLNEINEWQIFRSVPMAWALRHRYIDSSHGHQDDITYPLKLQVPFRAYSAVRLVRHGWAWPTSSNQQSCLVNRTPRLIVRQEQPGLSQTPSDVNIFVLTAISNENRKLSHMTPDTVTRTPEVATLAILLLSVNSGVFVSSDWDNTSVGSWCSEAMFTLSELTRVTRVVLPKRPLECRNI